MIENVCFVCDLMWGDVWFVCVDVIVVCLSVRVCVPVLVCALS